MSGAAAAEAAAIEAAMAAARAFNITLWTLYAFGVAVTVLRTYARHVAVGWRKFDADDYLVWVAVVLYSVQTTLGYQIGNLARGMANNGLDRPYRRRVHYGFAIVLVGWAASVGAVFLSCFPFYRYWQINPDPGNLCHPANSASIVWASFAANVTSDIYLLLIPLPLLWGSRLRLVKKLASTLVLGAGIFVLVCATLKTVFVVIDEVNGAELAGAWGTREAFVSVVTTNLPMVFPLFKTWLRPILGSSRRTTDKQYKTPPGEFRTIDGGSGDGDSSRKTRATRGKKPLTNLSFTESEERIVNGIRMQHLHGAGTTSTSDRGSEENGRSGKEANGEGIVVLTEFDVSRDKNSQLQVSGGQRATRIHEPR
ncbi:hypothetical protein QBC34DRAFT_464692 [Podospora aff. communis PSN243]|uniref:Rhodopsin domain-containing protein n=1 Tax=Podospora aff. communis PSN243 TaxID=3040156 RepID=A0AAV9GL08_9PEZI|nr:hypothetical protein QBC34DRAFT_464692 [Podospora aff. communis PSN243]